MEDLKKMVREESGESTHSHHHSHHAHHSSGHRKKRKRKISLKRIKEYIKKNKKVALIQVSGIVFFILCLAGVFVWGLSQRKISLDAGKMTGSAEETTDKENTVVIEVPFFEKDVVLVDDLVVAYIQGEETTPAKDFYKKRADGERIDGGVDLNLTFNVRGIPKAVSLEGTEILISEDASLQNAKSYSLKNGERTLRLSYLNVNTHYYYHVTMTFSNGATTSAQGSFKTADTPRILNIDGIYNVRDIGNWKTASGRRIKQGLLYRGTELDGAVEEKYTLTSKGMEDMLKILGIRMDMDLRASTDNKHGTDALGAGVEHVYYNAPMYGVIFADSKKAAVRDVFKDLARPENYPIYMHCTYGVDRTGTMCYLLEGLLGVSEEDMVRDYQLSALYHGGVNEEGIEALNQEIQKLPGYSMQEKIEGYLLSIGVTAAEIQSIRNIFLG